MSGFLLLFNHLFLPSLKREQERKFFAFCVPLVAAALGLLGQPLLPARLPGRREETREEEAPTPFPLYRPNILPFSPGKHGRGKSAGNKTQPCGTRRESKAPAGRASSADQRPIPASGQGKSLSGDTHACTKKPGPIGNRKCALSGAVFGRGRLRASLFTARQYGGLQCSLNASFVFF